MPRKRWPPSAVLTTPEAAHHVGLAASTLEKARGKDRNDGPPWVVLLRNAVRYRVSDLDAWVAERLTGHGGRRCANCPHRPADDD